MLGCIQTLRNKTDESGRARKKRAQPVQQVVSDEVSPDTSFFPASI